jgi:peptide deformylase
LTLPACKTYDYIVAVREIVTVPNPVLRQKARKIKSLDASIRRVIADMQETLDSLKGAGVGLAAPQIGEPQRIVVLSIPDKDEKVRRYCLVNPEIVKRKGERTVKEGCLSIPGYLGEITRCEQVKVKSLDETGKEVKLTAEGLLAQALEHEIDHLNGVLYVDHLVSQDKLKKVEPEKEKASDPAQQEAPRI